MQEVFNQFKIHCQKKREAKKAQLMQAYKAEVKRGANPQSLEIKFFSVLENNGISKEAAKKIKVLFRDSSLDSEVKFERMVSIAIKDNVFDRDSVKAGKLAVAVIRIFKTPQESQAFLQDPQAFITKHATTLSHHEKCLLEQFTQNEILSNFFKVKKFESRLTQKMRELHVETYQSADALKFKNCINAAPAEKKQMLKVAEDHEKKMASKGKVGTGHGGALGEYNRKLILNTAEKMADIKIGVCQEFAQLGVAQLLTKMELGVIERASIKMVSYIDGLGSHTFILLGHDSNDLTDLSKCVIVDPWAVAMGYRDTHGVFTVDNYPYMGMTDNLELQYHVDAKGNEVPVTKKALSNKGYSQKLWDQNDAQTTLESQGKAKEEEKKSFEEPKKVVKKQFDSVTAPVPMQPVVSQAPTPKVVPTQKVVAPAAVVSAAAVNPPAPVQRLVAPTVSARYKPLFHSADQKTATVTKNQALSIIDDCYESMTWYSKNMSEKGNLMQLLRSQVGQGLIEPGQAVLMALDICLTPRENVVKQSDGSYQWSRKIGETTASGEKLFGVLNQTNKDADDVRCFVRGPDCLKAKVSDDYFQANEMQNISDELLNKQNLPHALSPQGVSSSLKF